MIDDAASRQLYIYNTIEIPIPVKRHIHTLHHFTSLFLFLLRVYLSLETPCISFQLKTYVSCVSTSLYEYQEP